MKFLFIILVLTVSNAFADESKQSQKNEKEKSVQSVLKEAKTTRKKKVEICHECGKPEVNCDCEGEEHKKDE